MLSEGNCRAQGRWWLLLMDPGCQGLGRIRATPLLVQDCTTEEHKLEDKWARVEPITLDEHEVCRCH